MNKNDIKDFEGTLEEQISDLRAKIANLSSDLSEAVSSGVSGAGKTADIALDAARGNLRQAVSTVRHQGQNVVDAARENPGTATSLALTVGVFGLAIGYLIGTSAHQQPTSRWYR